MGFAWSSGWQRRALASLTVTRPAGGLPATWAGLRRAGMHWRTRLGQPAILIAAACCERSQHNVACINMRATHAILPWNP
jgi:hypothetical protein